MVNAAESKSGCSVAVATAEPTVACVKEVTMKERAKADVNIVPKRDSIQLTDPR